MRAGARGGGGRAERKGNALGRGHKHFLKFHAHTSILAALRRLLYPAAMSFLSLTHEPLTLQATEARLTAIYEAARKGLKGDVLAFAAGMKPTDYRRLAQFDPLVELAAEKGAADGEMELANTLHTAATRDGDTNAALQLLKHTRGWVAKQQLDVQVDDRISVLKALEMAEARVIEGVYSVENGARLAEAGGASTPAGSLTTRLMESPDGVAKPNTRAS
jgi:hypothetical protein